MTEENTIDSVFDFWKETENDLSPLSAKSTSFAEKTPEKFNIGQQRQFFRDLEGKCLKYSKIYTRFHYTQNWFHMNHTAKYKYITDLKSGL